MTASKPSTRLSIQRYLTRRLLLVYVLLLGLSSGLSYLAATDEVGELFDAQLAQSARVLAALLQPKAHDSQQLAEELLIRTAPPKSTKGSPQLGHSYEHRLAFQLWQNSKLQYRSATAPKTPMADATQLGFGQQEIAHRLWRTFVLDLPQQQRLVLGQKMLVRQQLILSIVLGQLVPGLLLLPVLLLLVNLTVRQGLQPLHRLQRLLEQRPALCLNTIELKPLPAELLAIVQALNALFTRQTELRQREQVFIRDAAHELRTPLAALKIHLSNLEQEQLGSKSLPAIHQITDRLVRLVQQLLTLSQLDAEHLIEPTPSYFELSSLAQQQMLDLSPLALVRQQDLELDFAQPLHYLGHEFWFGIMLQNLLNNAIKYSPIGGQIRLYLDQQAEQYWLIIEDSGPGIPDQQQPEVWQAFHRLAATSPIEGSGLGLTIVERIAQQHQIQLELSQSQRLGGLQVSLLLHSQRLRS